MSNVNLVNFTSVFQALKTLFKNDKLTSSQYYNTKWLKRSVYYKLVHNRTGLFTECFYLFIYKSEAYDRYFQPMTYYSYLFSLSLVQRQ